jgi:DNA-binding Xre family transcriptional regulator
MSQLSNPRFKNRIPEACEKKGIEPGELHKRIGRAQSTLSQIFSGKRVPCPDIIVAVCDELDCEAGDILYVDKSEK